MHSPIIRRNILRVTATLNKLHANNTRLNMPGNWLGIRTFHEPLLTHFCLISLVKVKLSLCLTNYALRHEDVLWSGCIDPRILDLGTSWRWVVNFTHRSLYPGERVPRYSLDRRLDGPQNQSGRQGEKSCPYWDSLGLELRPFGRPARSQSLYRLRYLGYFN
jgi:hypothetical protein